MIADYGGGLLYSYSAGTSFAAPAAAGAAAVVRKWYRNNHPGFDPSPALTKAILINGARDVANNHVLKEDFSPLTTIAHIPDDYQGWGTLNLNWLFGPQRYYFVDQSVLLSQGQYLDTILTIADGSQQTRITLVWTDPPSMAGSIPYTIVNNLDVAASALPVQCIVQNPCWFGNNWNTGTGDTLPSPPAAGYSDGTNNVEEIFIPANWYASGTQLLVRVVAQVVAQGVTQDYALVFSNAQ